MTIPGGFGEYISFTRVAMFTHLLTTGATLIGGLVSAMLYGITTLQTYVYYMHYSEDDSTTKFIVAIVWVMDTLHVSFTCHMLYYYLITNYGALMSLEYIVWSFSASLVVNSIVITIVQLFFAHKIYHLSRRKLRWLVTAPIIVLVLAQFGFSMATAVVTLVNDTVTYATQARARAPQFQERSVS
ncbi:hypothetical protein EDD15DRAFT_1454848 [Pisolithus albus]|nr:hypothetical protein EDD15DRAFT_1454848 [Pisolithus albus]